MKILHILNEFENIGNGIVNVCCDLACEQAKDGHDVLVVSSGGEYVELLASFGGKHEYLNQTRRGLDLFRMVKSFIKVIKKYKPDIVHAHMMTGALLTIIGRKIGLKYKFISTVHNVYQKGSFLMNYSDKIVCLSPKIYEYFINKKISKNRLVIIENGIIGSPRRISKSNIEKKNLQHPNLITLGAVCERKGSDLLFDSLCELLKNEEIHLYYIGNVDWPELKERIINSGYAKYVHFIGLEKQPLKYLLDGDIFVLPSRRETFPLSILEAKEAGLAIVASDTDGNPDALDYGMSGKLFISNNSADLTLVLKKLINNEEELLKLRQQSLQTSQKYTVKVMNQKYIDLYKSVL